MEKAGRRAFRASTRAMPATAMLRAGQLSPLRMWPNPEDHPNACGTSGLAARRLGGQRYQKSLHQSAIARCERRGQDVDETV